MTTNEEAVLTIVRIVRESTAMNAAALIGDFDEARFRAQLIVNKADAAGLGDVALAAVRVVERLGPAGSEPRQGYGEGMLAIAHALDNLSFEPR